MQITVVLVLNVDAAAIVEDHPPENLALAVADEIQSHLDATSVRGALGLSVGGIITVADTGTIDVRR